jgi:small subunit ribosomal protein S18
MNQATRRTKEAETPPTSAKGRPARRGGRLAASGGEPAGPVEEEGAAEEKAAATAERRAEAAVEAKAEEAAEEEPTRAAEGAAPSAEEGEPAERRGPAPAVARAEKKKHGRYAPRRKVCAFCVDRVDDIDYKDAGKLRRYLSDRGKIEPRRKTGTCAKHQRRLSVALKRARHLALLPYTGEHVRTAGVFAPRS